MQNQGKGTLADKIAGILNTAPSNFDPEEDAVDDTTAPTTFDDIEENNDEEEILSQFRKQNIDLLADVDEKYAGKKASRKSLRESSEEEDESAEDEEESDLEEEKEESGLEEEEEEEESLESDDAESVEEEGEEEMEESGSEEDDTNFKHIKDTNVTNQIKKGICVRNQMTMWENLLEARIQLQKCLLTANKFPQQPKFNEIKQESGQEFTSKVSETKNTLCGVLDKLLQLQTLVLKKFPETKNFHKDDGDKLRKEDEDDEEIASDTDIEESESEDDTKAATSSPRKRKLPEYEQEISKHHKKYKDYRNKVIQKWNDKTRVILKGGATSHSVLDQIEYNLSNRDKLVKRTQLKRSQYAILGEEEEGTEESKSGEEYYPEIYDDDDFYHQLLRELIEVKSADVTDPVQLGRQWIQLQSLRSKMKRKIDTRATKGRKIRYAVHNKLVNFMAPIDKELWTDEAKTELYNSLFGKNQPVFNV